MKKTRTQNLIRRGSTPQNLEPVTSVVENIETTTPTVEDDGDDVSVLIVVKNK
jgi:hypothetical protein